MADRFCGNCSNELRAEDRFCPNCGKPVHETAAVPTPEADVPVPPLPRQREEATRPLAEQPDTRTRRSDGVVEGFRRLEITVKASLGVAAIAAVMAVVI